MPAGKRIAWRAALALLSLVIGATAARAEFYRYVDDRGVVHLTDAPSDRRFQKYRPSLHGSGKGISILGRRSSYLETRFASFSRGRSRARGRETSAYDHLIRRVATRYEVPAALVKAVMKAESNFEPQAVSRKGAQGLMQLMPDTASDLGVENPFSAEQNVRGGARYLRAMKDRFGDWEHALAAYNAGPEAVNRHGGIPPYPETEQYVERVLHYYRRYDGDFSR